VRALKKLIIRSIAAILAVVMIAQIHIIEAEATGAIHEERQAIRLAHDTFLHEVIRVTSGGLLSFSVLDIPLNDPYLQVGVFNSQIEYGLKQPLTTLLNQQGALAGVNGDFFGLAGRHSVSLGFEAVGGHLSVHNDLNSSNNESASLILTDHYALFDYVRPEIYLTLNGSAIFDVSMANMVTNLAFPTFLTHGYFTDTSCIDERLGLSYKLVVENNFITSITHHTMQVPEDGFIVLMNPTIFANNSHLFYVGQVAQMNVSANIDINAVNAAISGSYRILHHGEVTAAANRNRARHPRTLMGLNAANNRLILMTIDGRGASVGAGLHEAAELMREFGAYHAVNLDGGGSASMAARLPGANMSLLNTPSEGAQRAIINALGVINNAPVGVITHLEIINPNRYAPIGIAQSLEIRAFDAYMNLIELPAEAFEISVLYNGRATENGFIAHHGGWVYLQVRLGDITEAVRYRAIEIAEIIPSVANIRGDTRLNFIGRDNEGRSVQLAAESLLFQANLPHLGEVEDNLFAANYESRENGWLTVAAHNARAFIPILLNPYNDDIYGLPASDLASDALRRFGMEAAAYNELDLLFYGEVEGYQSFYQHGVLTVQMDSAQSGLVAQNPLQWGSLNFDLRFSEAETIVIRMNHMPLQFSNTVEFGLFHRLLREQVEAGRNIFVVSTSGENSFAYTWDGIRYVNIAQYYGLFTLRLTPSAIYYEVGER